MSESDRRGVDYARAERLRRGRRTVLSLMGLPGLLMLAAGIALEFAHLKGNVTAVPFVMIVWGAGILLSCAWGLQRNIKKQRELRHSPGA